MRHVPSLPLLLLLALLPALLPACRPAAPQAPAAARPTFVFDTLAAGLYELSADGGGYPVKVVACVGEDGLLLVDTGERRWGEALADTLRVFGKGLPRVVINTHSHIEHVGGNPVVAKDAVIVGHRNLRERYLHGLYFFGDFPADALPQVTFTDSLALHFNGQDIRLAAFPGAHDDSDVLVWFERSRVAVAGALCMGEHFPSIDGDTGDIRRYPEVTARALARLPEDARIVPAHARDCTMAEARRFLDMLRETAAIVGRGRAAGKSLERMKAEDALAAYRPFESSYVSRQDWLTWWYEAEASPRPDRPRPYAPVIRALQDSGAAAAAETYTRLRRTHPGAYWYDDMALLYMGRRLSRLERWDDAVPFLDRCIAEWPGSEGAAQSHNVLSRVYERRGDSTRAADHAVAYLAKHPEDREARERMERDRAAAARRRP